MPSRLPRGSDFTYPCLCPRLAERYEHSPDPEDRLKAAYHHLMGDGPQAARGLTLLVPLLRRRKWARRAAERIADWASSEQRNPWVHAREATEILRSALADADEEVRGSIEYSIEVLSNPPTRDDEGRASAHFLVDGNDLTETGRNPEKGFDLRRQYEATVGKRGKPLCFQRSPPIP